MLRVFVRGFFTSPRLPAISLLDSWRGLLLGGQPSEEQEEAVKDLLATAIRLRKGRPQHTLPDELPSTLREYYYRLDGDGKLAFFQNLVSYFGVDVHAVDDAITAWQDAEQRRAGVAATTAAGAGDTFRAADRLWNASQPLYSRLWVPLSQQQDGITFLVRLRGDLLRCIAQQPSGAAPLRALAEDLRRRLAEWFSVGLLQLERVTWEDSSAAVVEKVMAEEKVHAISSWEDMSRRLGRNRRVFIWMHPSMPGEPLVALHVALSRAMLYRMSDIIGESDSAVEAETEAGGDAAPPTTAVFYSISNMHNGLSGVDLGNNLIKRAAKLLRAEVPTLCTLCTLSPLPGFAAWLDAQLTRRARGVERESLLLEEETAALGSAAGEHRAFSVAEQTALLQGALRGGHWLRLPELEAALRPPLLRLAAHYLLREKRRGQVLDPVGNFHLRNGAEVQSLNFRADESAAGMRRSHGVMVSYRYDVDPSVLEANNRRYVVTGEVAVAAAVQRLLQAGSAHPL